jgi:ribonuclease Z
VTLLATGVPIPSPDRFGPCTLVEAGDKKFLIDAGRGATIRLYQLAIPIGRIDVQLLTHYHSDHTSGVPSRAASSSCPPTDGRAHRRCRRADTE